MADDDNAHAVGEVKGRLRDRFVRFFMHYRPLSWVIVLTISLLLFLLALPDDMIITLAYAFLAQRYLAVSLFVFCLLALSLLWSTGQQIDVWMFLIFNLRGRRPKWLDWAMLAVTQVGNGITPFVFALFFYHRGDRRLAYILVLGNLTLWLFVELVKATVRRSRPFIRLSQTRIVGFRAIGRSFPSGHTSQSFFLAVFLARHLHVAFWLVFPLYGVAILVGVTRMYVGAHYPRDVVAGAILGSIWGYLASLV